MNVWRLFFKECSMLLEDPEAKKKCLAFYALTCGCIFFWGLEPIVEEWKPWRAFSNWSPMSEMVVSFALPFLLAFPFLLWLWKSASPCRGLLRDWRSWFFTAAGLTGIVLRGLVGEGMGVLELCLAAAIAALVWSFMVLSFVLIPPLQKGRLERLEKHEWHAEGTDAPLKGLGYGVDWQQMWWKEMSRREKWAWCLIYPSAFAGMFAAMVALALTDNAVNAAVGLINFLLFMNLVIYDQSYVMGRMFHEKKRHLFELQAARQMQLSLMPARDPDVEGLDIAGVSIPAEEVGGDLYDYFEPSGSQGSVGITVGDVSGKAMKAAIATVLVSGMLRSEYGRAGSPSDILRNVNHSLRGGLEAHGFVAMQVLTLAPRERIAHYTNAGQVYPLLRRGGKLQYFSGSTLPLGIAGESEYKDTSVSLEAGDVLLLVSDGITEAMNDKRELFGFERLETTLLGLPSELPARGMIDSILSQVRAFAGKAKQHDDMTIVVIKVGASG